MSTLPSKSELKKNLKLLKELLEARPMDLDARMRIARTYRLLGDDDEAVAHYGAVARYLSLAGNPLQAIAVLKELLQIAPRHEETLLFLAKLYARTRAADATNRGRVAVPILDGVAPAGDDGGVSALDQGMPVTATGIWRAIRPTSTADLTVVRDIDDVGAVVDEPDGVVPALDPEPIPLTTRSRSLASGVARLSPREEDALHRVPLFSSLDPAALVTLGHAMVQLRAEAGSVLFREGDPGDSCIVVTSGTATARRTVVEANGPRDVVLRKLGPGDVAGVYALMSAETRQATVVADTDLEYFEIDGVAVAAVVMSEPTARHALVGVMRERLLGSLFRDVPLFAAMTGDEHELLGQAFTEKEYATGDDLFADFDENDGLWVVVAGAVDVVDEGADASAPLSRLTVGDWVACLAGSEGSTAGLTAAVRSDCIALCLSHKRVQALVGGRGRAARLSPGRVLSPTVVAGSLRR
jgi:CRP/FNR family cyclic AMP-dependent transcriptional regulator